MESFEYTSAPRAVSVLPRSATRRLTRRDGLLPLVLALELLAGVAFGVAGQSAGSDATSVPARLTLGSAPVATVQPSMRPVAQLVRTPRVLGPTIHPSVAPVARAAQAPVGPAIGPLLPGTVRAPLRVAPLVVARPVVPVVVVPPAVPKPVPKHAPRDPFASLVTVPGRG